MLKTSIKNFSLLALLVLSSTTAKARQQPAQTAPPPPPAPSEPVRKGGFVPGQRRPPGDPAQIAHGKTLYSVNCRGCHGGDLRGGDLGGPNLLRSQVALSDLNGDLIVPIIHGSRQSMGMPAIGLNDADANAVAAYVRSVIETIKGQGAPPSAGKPVPSILIGNADEGKNYFSLKCAACHTGDKDLGNIATRIADPKRLQNAWLAGGARGEAPEADDAPLTPRTVSATVTLPSGDAAQGRLIRIDEFLITIALADGTQKTFRRAGDTPAVVIHDPLQIHRDLLSQYTDKDVHDVTAYLSTLK